MEPDEGDAAAMPLSALRTARMQVRRELELHRLRSNRATADPRTEAALLSLVRLLTDELVARYAADLTLVDTLLAPAYSRGVTDPPEQDRTTP